MEWIARGNRIEAGRFNENDHAMKIEQIFTWFTFLKKEDKITYFPKLLNQMLCNRIAADAQEMCSSFMNTSVWKFAWNFTTDSHTSTRIDFYEGQL